MKLKTMQKMLQSCQTKEKKALQKMIGLCLKRGIKEAGIEKVMEI